MEGNEKNQMNAATNAGAATISLEQMLESLYECDPVSADVKIRLKNRLACHRATASEGISFWWLPSTVVTVISFVTAVIYCVLYVVINITGVISWMPNLLQLVSELWLKINLVILLLEVIVSWLFTVIGIWKGNLIRSARIF